MQNERIMRIKEVCKLVGVSRASIYNFMKEGDFPQSIKIGKRAMGFSSVQVEDWVSKRLKSAA